jgi:hypothetical protein
VPLLVQALRPATRSSLSRVLNVPQPSAADQNIGHAIQIRTLEDDIAMMLVDSVRKDQHVIGRTAA